MAHNTTDRRPIVVVEAPAHPVTQLQGPFEESMFESQNGQVEEIEIPLDAATRRNALLEAPTYERIIAGRWRQKFGEKYHPLWKLVAQMSFGIHLLAEGMAKSEEDVFQILQTHVDDIDVFLERTTEDFTLAQEDIQERLKCLKLPLQHPDVFDRMLEDRTFRNSIVEGNEKIEHIVNRTGCSMKDALKDVQKGFDSTSSLERYLQELELTWVRTTPEHEAVFVAMLGNVEGWKRAFLDLHTSGNKLAGSLRKLTEVINQMQQRAGEVSRRLIRQQQRHGGSINGLSSITYISQQDQSSRSASRQQATPSPLGSKKPLPAPTSRTSTRQQQSRAESRNDIYTSRSGTSQSQRSGTSQSHRTMDSRSETPASRAQSRNEPNPNTATDDMQGTTRMNIGTPRMVYVKSHPGHHRANSQTASVRQFPTHHQPIIEEPRSEMPSYNVRGQQDMQKLKLQTTERNTVNRAPAELNSTRVQPSIPAELPAELPSSAFLQAPMSKINRLSIGLGILPSERRAQAQSRTNPTTALIELLSDPSRYSKLPSTPSSATSAGAALALLEGQRKLASHLQQAVMREPTPDQTPPKPGDRTAVESTPSTPLWASQISDNGRTRNATEMAPTRSYTPSHTLKDQSVREIHSINTSSRPKIDTSVNNPKGGPISSEPYSAATSSVGHAPSELSAGYENEVSSLLSGKPAHQPATVDHPAHSKLKKKKLSYIAELEGSHPIFLPSTVYTPGSSSTASIATHELEAPQTYFNLPPRTSAMGHGSHTSSEIDSIKIEDAQATPVIRLSGLKETEQIQIHMEESADESPAGSGPVVPNQSTDGKMDDTKVETELDNNEKTPRPISTKRMSAKIEGAQDLVHLPSITPPGSPLRPRPFSTASRNSAMLDDRRITTIYAAPNTETPIPPIPEELVSKVHDVKEKSAIDSQPDTKRLKHSESLLPAEKPGSPFPLTISTSQHDQEDRMSVGSSPKTPASIDLKRSNTKDSRNQWKAFFTGQLKSPDSSARSAPSTPSVGQHSPKKSRTSASFVQVESPVIRIRPDEATSDPERDATLISFLSSPSADDTDEDPIEKVQEGERVVIAHNGEQVPMSPGHHSLMNSYEQHDILDDYYT